MSFIRHASEGQYIDIPCGSDHYIYHNGNTINGWTEGEFAALIVEVLEECNWVQKRTEFDQSYGYIKQKFVEHFDTLDYDYRGGISPPERAEIFCQCVDRRIDELTLTDEMITILQEWVDSHDLVTHCAYCGDEFRPIGEKKYCGNIECQEAERRERYGISKRTQEQAARLEDILRQEYGYDGLEAAGEALDYIEAKGDVDEL